MNTRLIKAVTPPVAIGGVGGSGTRLIAQILTILGFYLGEDLNESHDTLWFTLLFKRQEILSLADHDFNNLLDLFIKRMTGPWSPSPYQSVQIRALAKVDRPPEFSTIWLQQRAESFLTARTPPMLEASAWGWKEPNTHIVIDKLIRKISGLRYIHVVRNGLDMAYSSNQNQLRFWGPQLLGNQCAISPYYSLKYWHTVHQRVLDHCIPIGKRFLLLNYDRFCLNPQAELPLLLKFLGIHPPVSTINTIRQLITPPPSIGRFKQYGVNGFDPHDVEFVKQLGFLDSLTSNSIAYPAGSGNIDKPQ